MNSKNEISLLIVDDEEDLLDIATEAFSSLGLNCITANCKTNAIEKFKNIPNKVILISDTDMIEKLEGFQLIRDIQEIDKEKLLGGVVVSGGNENEQYFNTIKQAEKHLLEDFQFREKPYKLDDLYAIVIQKLGKKRQNIEL